jgi:hypothetical protein
VAVDEVQLAFHISDVRMDADSVSIDVFERRIDAG